MQDIDRLQKRKGHLVIAKINVLTWCLVLSAKRLQPWRVRAGNKLNNPRL
jgi:hypothetical protein